MRPEEIAAAAGDAGKFLLYIWEDRIGPAKSVAEEKSTWSEIKLLYR
jgi:hypothetical protein